MPKSNSRSVILLSGGLDSSANLAFAALEGLAELALTIRYGQRSEEREVRAATRLAGHYGVPHEVVALPWLGKLGGSSLTDLGREIPSIEKSELDERGKTLATAKSVWVPNRNGILIQIAAAFAERRGAGRVVVGFNREEAATFPDNSVEFLDRASHALSLSTANHVQVHSYTSDWDKTEIVQYLRARDPAFPWRFLWSCYVGAEKPCGHCESCQRLARALQSV